MPNRERAKGGAGSPLQGELWKAVKNLPNLETSQHAAQEVDQNPLKWLHTSDSDEGDVCTVRVKGTGSRPQCARVMIQGVPVVVIIDTAADITIIGGTLFRKVANVAKLKKKFQTTRHYTTHL